MKDTKEFLYGKEFSDFDNRFHLLVIDWKEKNKQLLVDNNLENSNLFSSITPNDNVESLIFDTNVPNHIREEIKQLFISALP